MSEKSESIIASLLYGVLEEYEMIDSENIFRGSSHDYLVEIRVFQTEKENA